MFYILLVHFTNMKHFRSIPSWLLVGDLVKPPKVIGEIGRSRNLFQVAPEAAPKPARMDGGAQPTVVQPPDINAQALTT